MFHVEHSEKTVYYTQSINQLRAMVPPAKGLGRLGACYITDNGARVCTGDDTIAPVAAAAAVRLPAPCPPCPVCQSCAPTPSCPFCPCLEIPSPIPIGGPLAKPPVLPPKVFPPPVLKSPQPKVAYKLPSYAPLALKMNYARYFAGLGGVVCSPPIDPITGLPDWSTESCHLSGVRPRRTLGLTCSVDRATGKPFCSDNISSVRGGGYFGQLPKVLDYGSNISLRRPIEVAMSIPSAPGNSAQAPPANRVAATMPDDGGTSPWLVLGLLLGAGLLLGKVN